MRGPFVFTRTFQLPEDAPAVGEEDQSRDETAQIKGQMAEQGGPRNPKKLFELIARRVEDCLQLPITPGEPSVFGRQARVFSPERCNRCVLAIKALAHTFGSVAGNDGDVFAIKPGVLPSDKPGGTEAGPGKALLAAGRVGVSR